MSKPTPLKVLAEVHARGGPLLIERVVIVAVRVLCTCSVTVSRIQVESLTIRPERPLVVMSMTRPRRSFGLPCKLVDRDAYDWLTDDYMAKVKTAGGGGLINGA